MKPKIGNPLNLLGGTFWEKLRNGVVILFAFIYFVQSGLIKVGIIASRDTVAIVGPDAAAAFTKAGDYLPGAPSLTIKIGSNEYNLFGGKDPGGEYTSIWGPGSQSAQSGFSGKSGTTALSIDALTTQYSGKTPTDPKEKEKQYLSLVRSLVDLVGGSGYSPNFSTLEPHKIIAARNTIAAMKAIGFDTVNPVKWEAELEKAVIKAYGICFKKQDFECVDAWGPLMSKVVMEPDGLRDWLTLLLKKDQPGYSKLLRLAINTNAQEIGNELVGKAFNEAKTARVAKAKANTKANKATATDILWMFAGRTVNVTVDEGFQLPAEVGGNRGKLDKSDKITLRDSLGLVVTVDGDVALAAIATLSTATTQAQFSPQPLDPKTLESWAPGQDLP